MMLFEKFGQHQPLNRQAERYAREGVPLSLSTLADQVGAGCAVLEPLLRRIEPMSWPPSVCTATTRPCRCWPRARPIPGAAGSTCARPAVRRGERRRRRCSTTRATEAASILEAHLADWSGILQADAYGGYSQLYAAERQPGPILEAACWAHARRPFFALADIEASARRKAEGKAPAPISPWRWRPSGASMPCSRSSARINGQSAEERRAVRQELSAAARRRSGSLDAGGAGQALRAAAMSPRPWTTCSSAGRPSRASSTTGASAYRTMPPSAPCAGSLSAASRGCSPAPIAAGERAAAMYSLIVTAKMNDIDPQAWLADVLARIAEPSGPSSSTSCCRGTGARPTPPSAAQPEDGRHCGPHRMLTAKRGPARKPSDTRKRKPKRGKR